MSLLAEQLTGEIPGLLRRGSPVTCTSDCDGVVALVYTDGAIAVAISDREIEPSSPDIYALDLTSRTGRFHAREWLAERGHYVGSEDRAEVLAWSVLSVWRGGAPIRLVLGRWWQQDSTWRRDGWRGTDKVTAAVGPTNTCGVEWEILTWFPNSTSRDAGHYGRNFANIEDAKAACDAAAIASRWAITNDDGSLTLPPLPGAS